MTCSSFGVIEARTFFLFLETLLLALLPALALVLEAELPELPLDALGSYVAGAVGRFHVVTFVSVVL